MTPNQRLDLARDLSTPVELLAQLATDSWWLVRYSVAWHPSTSPELLSQLATDAAWDVRCVVARRPSTPVELLAQLASDADRDVRCAVTRHPSAPAELLAQLAADVDENVRRAVAEHPSAPPDVLKRLACDDAWAVRLAVADFASDYSCAIDDDHCPECGRAAGVAGYCGDACLVRADERGHPRASAYADHAYAHLVALLGTHSAAERAVRVLSEDHVAWSDLVAAAYALGADGVHAMIAGVA